MGREVRRVPAGWQHPTYPDGSHVPLFDKYRQRVAEWDTGAEMWDKGLVDDFRGGWEPKGTIAGTYAEYAGEAPDPLDYMPDWPESERTHWQMYEDTSEGTPLSPVMETQEQLARWLADNRASAFGDYTATYEQWMGIIKQGYHVPIFSRSGGA